jgi:hypothetical protein
VQFIVECFQTSNIDMILFSNVIFDVFKHAGVFMTKKESVNFLTDPPEGRSTPRSTDVLVYE